MVGMALLTAGKIILWILAGLLALLLIALLIPAKVRFQYEAGEPFLAVRYGPVKLQLFPAKEKPKEKPKETAEKKKKKPSKKKKTKAAKGKVKKSKPKKTKPKKPKAKINREQILYALEKLPPILGRALKRTGRSIRVGPLKLYLLAAGADPADTAQLYGRLEAALAAGVPILEKTLRIRDLDVRLYADFQEERMDFIADAGVSLRLYSLVWMALRAGGSLLKWYIGFRKLASPPPEPEADKEKTEKAGKDHEAA